MADEHVTNSSGRRRLKRKLDAEFTVDDPLRFVKSGDVTVPDLVTVISACVDELKDNLDAVSVDRVVARRCVQKLAEFAKDEDNATLIVEVGAIPVLVKCLQEPGLLSNEAASGLRPYELEVEKESAITLGLLAIKPERQQVIVDAGTLPHLVAMLKRHKNGQSSRAVNRAIRKAADSITNLAHENSNIKTLVRVEGGIPPLVELLKSSDKKVQRSAAGALRTLAFKNDENKTQIVSCNALPTLVLMLQSEDVSIHYEAVGAVGNLVHSSPDIKKEVLLAGALQPVIELLSSTCIESQREAALLIGQFAAADTDCKVHIVQRGAAGPLIKMLQSPEAQLKEMSAFAIGRLAQDTHNQAGIAYGGGITPLLKLLDSKNGTLQHNGAFALYGLADNEDNVADFVRVGGIQKLLDGEYILQPTRDCVAKMLKRLKEKTQGRVLRRLLYLMLNADKVIQRRISLALAHLCSPGDLKTVFVDNNGIDLLMELLQSIHSRLRGYASVSLCKLAEKTTSLSSVDAGPSSPTSQVYLGEKYVNNPTLSDVTFVVEGKRFYAHRICLLASSDAFRAMFDGGYREKDAKDIKIPNISWETFELMMRYIYTGSVEISSSVAHDLLKAADQYLLEGLKRCCEYTIAQDITADNVELMYDLSEAFNAVSLRNACILFILEHFQTLDSTPWYGSMVQRILPEIRTCFVNRLTEK
ncbi:ARM REPEAT PROTEIN INTERACTING WITH ABF2-like [Bidens hawaiensis]|uniref:ARM REPEAT PROTEIN INTERACTING WITH ABF2-like n=1 Tax=Bidens hawaiensis TaxID=980011 RepID=UPI00404A0173